MAQLVLNIDRISDPEVIIVKCYIDGEKLDDDYFIDLIQTDEWITNFVRTDLQNKGYVFI